MNKRLLSIIVPVYNAEEFLEQCLNSIFTQSLKNIEVIIVNDGSTDGSLDIINKFKQKNNNLVLVNQPNQGVIKARINGYNSSSGR